MTDSPQHIYAKNLPNSRGFPLWFPEPSITLPLSYQQDGLQIGDVGIVSPTGRFDVLFNISQPPQHALHQRHLPFLATFKFDPIAIDIDQELDVRSNADPAGSVIMSPGITRIFNQFASSADTYEFVSTSASGAILILPDGATCHELLSKERFRTIAMERAFDWYEIARRRYGESIDACSLYLITGFHKARSWCIASYHDPTSIEQKNDRRIKVTKQDSIEGGTARRCWEYTFPVHCRDGPGGGRSGNTNQTVYISGFKIAVREDVLGWWTREPAIEPVPAIPTGRDLCSFARFLKKLFRKRHSPRYPREGDRGKTIDYIPALSPPFHPSDAINRFLLKQDPSALVAVTHDSQWIAMVETGEVMSQDLVQKEWFERYLLENYSLTFQPQISKYSALRTRVLCICGVKVVIPLFEFTTCSLSVTDKDGSGIRHEPACDMWKPWDPTPSAREPQVIITRIRAENVATGLGRMPVGICVVVEFNGTRRKTKNKPVRANNGIIEWDDLIVLPSQTSSMARLSVCASFELSPMIGMGEVLYAFERSVEEWEKSDPLIQFSRKDGNVSCSSLVTKVERRALQALETVSCGNDADLGLVPHEIAQQTDLGHHAFLRHRNDPTQENIDIAIHHFECARKLCPSDHPCRSPVMRNLAKACMLDYEINNTYTSLDRAISYYREALDWCPVGHPDRPASLVYLAQALVYRYDQQGCEESVEREIKKLVAGIRDTCSGDSHEYRAAVLALQTCSRCMVVNDTSPTACDKLISELDLAARAHPLDYFDRPQRMYNLGAVLFRRYELCGGLSELNISIAIHEEAIGLAPAGHPYHIRINSGLCDCLSKRFEHTRDLTDLEECISTSKMTLHWVEQTNVHRARLLACLCDSLAKRFDSIGHFADLEKCISASAAALQWATQTNGYWVRLLASLCNSFTKRFDCTCDLMDVEYWVSTSEAASHRQLVSQTNVNRARLLASFCDSLTNRFNHTGDFADLVKSISVNEVASQLVLQTNIDRIRLLASFCDSLVKRFDHTGDLADLDKYVSANEAALQLAKRTTSDAADNPDYEKALGRLASAWKKRYYILADMTDLNGAIQMEEERLFVCPFGHPHHAEALGNLAISLSARYRKQGNLADLDNAIDLEQKKLVLCSPDRKSYGLALRNLVSLLKDRYKKKRDPSDLINAIELLENALESYPAQHSNFAFIASELAAIILLPLKPSKKYNPSTLSQVPLPSLDEAFAAYKKLEGCAPAVSLDLWDATQAWVKNAEKHDHSSVLEAYQTSLNTLDHFTSLNSDLDVRHEIIQARVADLASDAFSCATRKGNFQMAIELLERGRGILWSQLARCDIPVTALQNLGDEGRELGNKYVQLSADLRKHAEGSEERGMEPYWRVLHEWQSIVDKIRRLEGFSRFLLPPRFEDLQQAAEGGPVIIANASEHGCDAVIILGSGSPIHVPLPCSLDDVILLRSELSGLTDDLYAYGDQRDAYVKEMLRDLWALVVEPVAKILQNEIQLPLGSRIWWCPTSKFTIMPFHAAGPHRKAQKNLMDLYVSSYAPSLRALVRARERVRSQRKARGTSGVGNAISFAAVGQARPSAGMRLTELPAVEPEIDKIRNEASASADVKFDIVFGDKATIEGAVQAFRDHRWIHLACHGAQHTENPFESWFAMKDGKLTLMRLIQERYMNSEFAFFSSVHSAMRDRSTTGETLHLAAGMQFTGFSGVVGVLWRVDDAVAHQVIIRFYRKMFRRPVIDFEYAAEALNMAVIESAKEVSLERRIVFAHFGI